MIKVRKHRGSFSESLETMEEIPDSLLTVLAYFNEDIIPEVGKLKDIKFAYAGFDYRPEWNEDTYYVIGEILVLGGNSIVTWVLGMCNKNLTPALKSY